MLSPVTGDPIKETQEFLAAMDRQREFVWKYRDFKTKIQHYFLFRLQGDHQTAEDLSSELFLRTYERFASYDNRYAFSTWLYTIARNMLVDYLRSNTSRATKALEDGEDIPADEEHFFECVDRAKTEKMLYAAMERLPALQRDAVYRKHILFESTAEISKRIGRSEPAVRQLISRGCRALHRIMVDAGSHPSA